MASSNLRYHTGLQLNFLTKDEQRQTFKVRSGCVASVVGAAGAGSCLLEPACTDATSACSIC